MQSLLSVRIDKYLGVNLHNESYVCFWNFVILWNLFESRLFDNKYSPKALDGKSLLIPCVEVVQDTLSYLKTRYVTNGNLNSAFQRLHLRGDTDKESLVKDVLLGNEQEQNAQIEAIIVIIGRYRNNLFHGIKEIASIDLQKDTFEIANKFLMTILENNR